MDQQAKKQQQQQHIYDRKSARTRQNNKTGDSKVESNDSPEIPDKRGDIRHPRPPLEGSV